MMDEWDVGLQRRVMLHRLIHSSEDPDVASLLKEKVLRRLPKKRHAGCCRRLRQVRAFLLSLFFPLQEQPLLPLDALQAAPFFNAGLHELEAVASLAQTPAVAVTTVVLSACSEAVSARTNSHRLTCHSKRTASLALRHHFGRVAVRIAVSVVGVQFFDEVAASVLGQALIAFDAHDASLRHPY